MKKEKRYCIDEESQKKIRKVSEELFKQLNMEEICVLTTTLVETFIQTYGQDNKYNFYYKRKDNKELNIIEARKVTMLINE